MSWTQYQDEFLKNNVGKITYRNIATELKKGCRTISRRVKQLRLSGINLNKSSQFQKIFSVNESFFDKVNALSSYYAGLIAADGCVYKNTISLTQSMPRSYAIKRFKRYVDYDGKIYRVKREKGYDSFTITITSKRWKNALECNFGIIPKKSLILRCPHIDDFDCVLSFIVGLIDGDGTIGFYGKKDNRKMALISLCGTRQITEWVFQIWLQYCYSAGNRQSGGPRQITENNTWETRISGFKAIKFYNLVKHLDIPKMESKWGIFEKELNEKGELFYLKDFSKKRPKGKNGRFI